MAKFHISEDRIVRECKAKGKCPLGGSDIHFDNIREAENYANELNKLQYGNLPIAAGNELSDEWKSKFLSSRSFNSFADQYASELVDSNVFTDDIYNSAKKAWLDIHYSNSASDYHRIAEEDAVNIVRDEMRSSALSGWFRDSDSEYKPEIEQSLITSKSLRNASLNIAHRRYEEMTGKSIEFNDFINSEIEVYRGGNFNYVDEDVFVSYSFDRKIAEDFANQIKGSEVQSLKVKIKDTLGSLQTTKETEIMVPVRLLV